MCVFVYSERDRCGGHCRVCVCVCLSNLAVSIIIRWWKQQVNVVTPTAGGTLSQSSIMGAFKEMSSSSKSKLFRKYSNESLNGCAVCFCGGRSFQPNLVEDGADRLIRSAVTAARHRKRWSLRPCSGWHQRRVKKPPKWPPLISMRPTQRAPPDTCKVIQPKGLDVVSPGNTLLRATFHHEWSHFICCRAIVEEDKGCAAFPTNRHYKKIHCFLPLMQVCLCILYSSFLQDRAWMYLLSKWLLMDMNS